MVRLLKPGIVNTSEGINPYSRASSCIRFLGSSTWRYSHTLSYLSIIV